MLNGSKPNLLSTTSANAVDEALDVNFFLLLLLLCTIYHR